MKSLVVTANPNKNGFGAQLTNVFINGIKEAGHEVNVMDLFAQGFHCSDGQTHDRNLYLLDEYRERIQDCDSIAFSFPMWCEMPPYPMAAFIQQVFVKGFAYEHDGIIKTPILNLPMSMLVTMGQKKDANLQYLIDALSYVGLHLKNWQLVIAPGVGPNMQEVEENTFKERAYLAGKTLFEQ